VSSASGSVKRQPLARSFRMVLEARSPETPVLDFAKCETDRPIVIDDSVAIQIGRKDHTTKRTRLKRGTDSSSQMVVVTRGAGISNNAGCE
jgi:hypothetical protein